MKKLINEIVTGYKATDKDMKCRGFQFELGVWHKHDGEVAMCESGFHFCEYPSGPWAFYSGDGTRMFKVEARGVILGEGPGADLKHVAMEIRLVEEITITGDRNTGNWNTGDGNATDRCSGYLCTKKQQLVIFDELANDDDVDFRLINNLCRKLSKDEDFDVSEYLSIPNATEEKIRALHIAHKERRKK